MNRIWDLREQGLITSHECDLYSYLVHRSNRLGWKNPFNQSSDILCAVLGINRNSLSRRRRRLCDMGLICFKEGETKTRPAEYELCETDNFIRKVTNKKRKTKVVITATRPLLTDVEIFCKERGSIVDARLFHDYYEAKEWKVNGQLIADWRSVLIKWERNKKYFSQKDSMSQYSKSISDVEF